MLPELCSERRLARPSLGRCLSSRASFLVCPLGSSWSVSDCARYPGGSYARCFLHARGCGLHSHASVRRWWGIHTSLPTRSWTECRHGSRGWCSPLPSLGGFRAPECCRLRLRESACIRYLFCHGRDQVLDLSESSTSSSVDGSSISATTCRASAKFRRALGCGRPSCCISLWTWCPGLRFSPRVVNEDTCYRRLVYH